MRSRLNLTGAVLWPALLIFFGAGIARAQHEPGGGTASGAVEAVRGSVTATMGSGHRSSRPPVRRRTTPVHATKTLDADDYYEQGEKYFDAKQYAPAIEAYKKATRSNSDFAEAY